MLKKKTYGYIERDEKARQEFQKIISKIDPNDLIYMDEAGIDDTDTALDAWGLKGQRIYGMKKGAKKQRVSIASALSQGKLIAPFMFEGSCDRNVFETYLKKVLLPVLSPGKFIVLDNAAFHHGGNISELIESVGCKALYLPPYSPDLNPIEHFWFSLKNKIRKLLPYFSQNLYETALNAFGE